MSLNNKIVLVTGGTGSFGKFIVRRLLDSNVREVRVFSRDEKKQYDMRLHYAGEKRIRFITGDVRDLNRVREAMHNCALVFQAAALKHVFACELQPFEAVKTNVAGAENVISAAMDARVARVVTVSTDKAVKPVNVMGMTKALQERLTLSANNSPANQGTKLSVVRYGNVMNSRGSAVPFFRDLVAAGKPITITHPAMTRFLLTLNDAVDLVLFAAKHMKGGETFVKKAPTVRILDLAAAIAEEGGRKFDHKVIGVLPGEKFHEVLISEEELQRTRDLGDYYVVAPWWEKKFTTKLQAEYSSEHNIVSDLSAIRTLLAKSDAEFRALGFKGVTVD